MLLTLYNLPILVSFGRKTASCILFQMLTAGLLYGKGCPSLPFPVASADIPLEMDQDAPFGVVYTQELLARIDAMEDIVIKNHLHCIACIRNSVVVDVSPTATALLACTTAALLLGCAEGC